MIDMTFEPKEFALELAGTLLSFPERPNPDPLLPPLPAFGIPSIPNFDTFHVESHNAGTVTEEAYFSFLVKTMDETLWEITEDMECNFTDGDYVYSFFLIDSPQPDMTGWSILKANYRGKANV